MASASPASLRTSAHTGVAIPSVITHRGMHICIPYDHCRERIYPFQHLVGNGYIRSEPVGAVSVDSGQLTVDSCGIFLRKMILNRGQRPHLHYALCTVSRHCEPASLHRGMHICIPYDPCRERIYPFRTRRGGFSGQWTVDSGQLTVDSGQLWYFPAENDFNRGQRPHLHYALCTMHYALTCRPP